MSDQANSDRALEVQEKQELDTAREQTVEGSFYRPLTDIYETDDALHVVMEMPGVDRDDIDIHLEKDQLTITGRIGIGRYSELSPLYTEYGVGHFTRSFDLSNVVDQGKIEAKVDDGVLTLRLPKVVEAAPRRIKVK